MTGGNEDPQHSETLQRLITEDAVGQLRRRQGRMATLGSENGELKLDWVEGVARLLADPTQLEQVEAEATALWQQGIRHIIWAGMGGSVLTIRVMAELGFCDGHNGEHIAIYPLDSTDPAALNAIVRKIAAAKQLTLPTAEKPADQAYLQALLNDVMMIGVAMGMTSEEPITHLAWFTELLNQAQLSPAEHLLVMTLPGSYLDQFAQAQHAPSRPLQLDGGTGTGGRMSSPATRVFLLPAALYLTRTYGKPGHLRATLNQAWQYYQIDLAATHPAEHPFVQLAAALYDASAGGACKLLLEFPAQWQALVAWIEQLMEESLGKGNKGIVIFKEAAPYSQEACFRTQGTLYTLITTDEIQEQHICTLNQPYLDTQQPQERLAALAASFLGWQLTMALYGYLHTITFAGQPAVENYKARARTLRDRDDPLQAVHNWPATFTSDSLTLLGPANVQRAEASPAATFAETLQQARAASRLGYLDLTINGEATPELEQTITKHLHTLGNELLRVPVKPRHAPAAYHSTEQSEMDGPPDLVSLRLLLREHEAPILGIYNDAFLRAQAVSTWQAMIEQGRTCFLLIIDGSTEQATGALQRFFEDVERFVGVGG